MSYFCEYTPWPREVQSSTTPVILLTLTIVLGVNNPHHNVAQHNPRAA